MSLAFPKPLQSSASNADRSVHGSAFDSAIEAIGAVAIRAGQIERALALAAMLPPYAQDGGFARVAALGTFAAEEGIRPEAIAGAALQARLVALERFVTDHDPERRLAIRDLATAAAVARLVTTGTGPAFEPVGFAELVAFSADMPF